MAATTTTFWHRLGVILLAASADVVAQSSAQIETQQLLARQQRLRAQEGQAAAAAPDVRLSRAGALGQHYPPNEVSCFPIRRISLEGTEAARFQWALGAVADARGRCLGTGGVNVVLSRVQNALIGAGYVTARVLAAPQDLRDGTLALILVAGRIEAIRFANPGAVSYRSALPARPGDLLNLRDVEQGLENFKRVPSVEADIRIDPGSSPGASSLVIVRRQGRPWHLNLAVDDGGSAATGKTQGSVMLALDNPLGLHDLFNASISNDLNGKGAAGSRASGGHMLHYSLPFGYWLLAGSVNDYHYRQSVAGAAQTYLYRGTNRNRELKLARVMYRDAVRKLGMALRAYRGTNNNFIDDTEIDVQRRRTRGFEFGLNGKQFLGSATLNGALAYRRGRDENSARPRVVYADLNLSLPFAAAGQRWAYQVNWRAQFDRSPLAPQDRFAIGGRYTVRGFDGESSLAAERGWVLRNECALSLPGVGQQVYLGLDYASVGGPASALLVGRRLGGAALGWRGQWKGAQYELFAGKPITKPMHFQTDSVATGFQVAYQFD